MNAIHKHGNIVYVYLKIIEMGIAREYAMPLVPIRLTHTHSGKNINGK